MQSNSDDRGTDGKHRRLEEVSFAFFRADGEVLPRRVLHCIKSDLNGVVGGGPET